MVGCLVMINLNFNLLIQSAQHVAWQACVHLFYRFPLQPLANISTDIYQRGVHWRVRYCPQFASGSPYEINL